MQSISHSYFGKFFRFSLRAGIGFVMFCAVTSVLLAGCGWLKFSPPLWTGALLGLLSALLFDRLAWRGFDTKPLDVWQDVPRWQFGAVLGVFGLVLATAAYFLWSRFSIDPLCHHGITNSILAFGVPVLDLGAPDRFLPYHALGNLLAATLASAIQPANPSTAVEVALDIVSLCSLALLLALASVLFALLLGVFSRDRCPGPIWLCFLYPLLVFGGGPVALAQLIPDVFNSADCYADFGALTFHPMLQYLGRRSAVPGFAIFLVLVCILLLSARRAFAGHFAPLAIVAACFVALSYSSLDMLMVALLLICSGLFFADSRRTAMLGVSAFVVAAPFIAVQGGYFTAALFNAPLPDAKSFSAWELRGATLVGFFRPENLGGIPLTEPFAWLVLALDFPWFLASIPLAGLLLINRRELAEVWLWVLLLLGLSVLIFAAPFFIFFALSPWDIHRLYFWPMIFGAILTPVVLVGCIRSRAVLRTVVPVLLAVCCGSALITVFLRATGDFSDSAARTPHDFRARLGFNPQHGKTWVASAGAQSLLFMNGCRVLAAPFGTAGPVYYMYPPLLLEALVQNRLASPDTGGANMALLNPEDLAFLRKNHRGKIEILGDFAFFKDGNPLNVSVVRLGDAESHDIP